jgi:hypothetical protein
VHGGPHAAWGEVIEGLLQEGVGERVLHTHALCSLFVRNLEPVTRYKGVQYSGKIGPQLLREQAKEHI